MTATVTETTGWCYSCGARVRGARTVAPLCERCTDSGPQVPAEQLRWYLLEGERRAVGPLARQAVIDRLVSGHAGPDTPVQRVGGEWTPLAEHRDFRAVLLPGSPEYDGLARQRGAVAKESSSRRRGDLARRGGALAILAGASAIGVLVVSSRALIVPEAWLDRASGWFSDASSSVGEQVDRARDPSLAAALERRDRELPAAAEVAALQAAWPAVDAPVGLLIHQGRTALWLGTRAGAAAARTAFEQAVVRDPLDADAVGGLVEALSGASDLDPSLHPQIAAWSLRVDALAPGSVASSRAQAAVALAAGNPQAAELAVATCGAPAAAGGTEGGPDLGCALQLARAREDRAALLALATRFPDLSLVQLTQLRMATSGVDPSAALEVSRRLTRQLPGEAEPWAARARAAAAVGSWKEAAEAAGQVNTLEPQRLDVQLLRAQLLLRVDGDAAAARAVAATIEASPAFAGFHGAADTLALASDAAGLQGEWDAALALAGQALALDAGSLGGRLARARAAAALKQDGEVDTALRAGDPPVDGLTRGRTELAAAQVYRAAGRSRAYAVSAQAALDAAPDLIDANLMLASARLEMGDAAGALDRVLATVWQDPTLAGARGPLAGPFLPPEDWRSLRSSLVAALEADIQLAPKAALADALLLWHIDPNAARSRLLQVADATDAAEAHMALAWMALAAGRAVDALPKAERALASHPDDGVVVAVYAAALADAKRSDEAWTYFDKALGAANDRPGPHRWRARALARAGRQADALQGLDRVLELSPGDVDAVAARLALREVGG